MTVTGRACRDRSGDPVPRLVESHLGRLAIRPLSWGQALRYYDSWPDSMYSHPARRAAIFRYAVVGCESITADDVAAFEIGFAAWLEYAVLAASGMIDDENTENTENENEEASVRSDPSADTALGSTENDEADVQEIPENSLIATASEADEPEPAQDLDDYRESDTIYGLHDAGYTWESIYGLLMPELESYHEGAEREADRRERDRSDTEADTDADADASSGTRSGQEDSSRHGNLGPSAAASRATR